MDRQTVERRREYVQNIRNSFYEENGMQKRGTGEVDDSAPEMGLAAALKLRIFCDNHYYTNLKNYVMIH